MTSAGSIEGKSRIAPADSAPLATAATTSPSPEDGTSGWFPSRAQFFGCLLFYFALQVVIRTLLSSSADLDEAGQLLLTQKLSWGYGPQPPLYTWIQIGFFKAFGLSIFSLSVFKNLLLFCSYLLAYLNARQITRNHACGVAAAVSLLFIPQISWESQRDLTHSVLASTMSLATLFAFLRLAESPRPALYLLFGACLGFGAVSKYNYVFFPAGLFAAALSIRQLRNLVLHPSMLLALAVAVVVFLPNGLWILEHRDLAFLTTSKFRIKESGDWIHVVASGLEHALVSIVTFIGPMALVYALVFLKASPHKPACAVRPEFVKLLSRTLFIILGAVALLILFLRATSFRERWFQPLLVGAPILAVAIFHERLDQTRLKRLVTVGALAAAAVIVVMPGRLILAERLHRDETLTKPFDALAVAMRGDLDPLVVVVAESPHIAGNLRLALRQNTVVTPELAGLFAPDAKRFVLVWDATKSMTLPQSLRDWAQPLGLSAVAESDVSFVSATCKFHGSKQARLGILRLN